MFAFIGVLAVQGGDRLQSEYPNLLDYIGGWHIVYFLMYVHIAMMFVFSSWILIIGREQKIYYLLRERMKNLKDKS
jgi:hypothetical protein